MVWLDEKKNRNDDKIDSFSTILISLLSLSYCMHFPCFHVTEIIYSSTKFEEAV